MSESKQQWTPGPWTYSRWDEHETRFYIAQQEGAPYTPDYSDVATLVAETCSGERIARQEANAKLIAAAPELVEVAIEARAALVAYLDDHPHVSPHDCYATGPKTGDAYHDLVRCPGCCAQDAFMSLISGIDAALAKAGA